MTAAIEITNLNKTYRQSKREPIRAVNNLSLRVPAGQVLGFLGANGAGKTTTIKMMCGLVIPDSGTVKLNTHDVRRQRSQAMRQVGAVLEGTRNVYWRMSAWQNLIYYARLKGVPGKVAAHRAERLLHALQLWERRDQPVGGFSRGMQQKVAIACALVADPPIVLLDEPTLGLDVQAARTVKQWIRTLSAQEGKTVVLTTHQLDMAQELCDRVAIIRNGELMTDQPTYELLRLFQGEYYEIVIGGSVDPAHYNGRLAHLTGFHCTQENGHSVFAGPIRNQDELVAIIGEVHALDLPLVSVQKSEPSLEEVFVRLLEAEHQKEGAP